MVDMDSWCPNCGYSVEPGTRFCGGCGYQFAAQSGVPATQSSTVTMQAPPPPYPGYPGYPAGPPLSAPVASPAGPSQSAPPPPSGSPLPYPPPPAPGQPAPGAYPGQPGADPSVSDTLEKMMRPQGLFRPVQLTPGDWQQQPPPPPAPGGYPQGGQYPATGGFQQAGPYQQPNPYPQGGQYPATGGFQQAGPPAWPGAALPPGATLPPGAPPGGYPGPYGNGQNPGAQYPGGQYPNGQYGQELFNSGQYGPDGVVYGPDGTPIAAGGPGQPGPPGLLGKLRARRPKGPLVPVVIAAAVVVVVVAALMLSMSGSPSSSTASNGLSSGASASASSPASGAMNEQQAASALSGLLSQSGTDHADVNAAVTNVEGCKGLAADAKTFSKASGNRRTLLTKLSQLPGRAVLAPAMLADLTGAWQASATVDADLAKWASDGIGHCKKNNTADPNYTATLPFDSKATNDKTSFVKAWNGLAKKYGLPAYSPSQI
jgi:hypothetical protein